MEKNNKSDEPIIIGTLRKEKSSKPIFVFIVLAIIIGITFALPYIEEYLTNPNTALGGIYSSIFGTPKVEDREDLPIIDNNLHILNNKTTINFKTIIINNINLNNDTITYNIRTTSNTLNLDESNYYFEVYGSNDNLLERIKLTGELTPIEEERTFTFKTLKFNSGVNYFGKITELTNEDYEDIILNSDESGISSIICNDSNNKYEYIFDNYELKNIKHSFEYTYTNDIEIYLNMFQKHTLFTEIINNIKENSSTTEETNNGFIFTANLDLNTINKKDLKEADNHHYYNLNKLAKIIDYDMKVQGFICK